jgi:hypothetical protein
MHEAWPPAAEAQMEGRTKSLYRGEDFLAAVEILKPCDFQCQAAAYRKSKIDTNIRNADRRNLIGTKLSRLLQRGFVASR